MVGRPRVGSQAEDLSGLSLHLLHIYIGSVHVSSCCSQSKDMKVRFIIVTLVYLWMWMEVCLYLAFFLWQLRDKLVIYQGCALPLTKCQSKHLPQALPCTGPYGYYSPITITILFSDRRLANWMCLSPWMESLLLKSLRMSILPRPYLTLQVAQTGSSSWRR